MSGGEELMDYLEKCEASRQRTPVVSMKEARAVAPTGVCSRKVIAGAVVVAAAMSLFTPTSGKKVSFSRDSVEAYQESVAGHFVEGGYHVQDINMFTNGANAFELAIDDGTATCRVAVSGSYYLHAPDASVYVRVTNIEPIGHRARATARSRYGSMLGSLIDMTSQGTLCSYASEVARSFPVFVLPDQERAMLSDGYFDGIDRVNNQLVMDYHKGGGLWLPLLWIAAVISMIYLALSRGNAT